MEVILDLVDLKARTRVYDHDYDGQQSFRGMASPQDGLASDWEGWEGIRSWTSLEGDLSLACTHDQLKMVTVVVELKDDPGFWTWRVKGGVGLRAGEPRNCGAQFRRFLG